LIIGALVAAVLARWEFWVGIAAGFVVAHFFLFCNVLRMSRPSELIWAGTFAILAVAASVFGFVAWPVALVEVSVLTVILTIFELRRPSYHGVGWQRVNPQLPEWWAAHTRSEI
jgi:hypothetical protein